MSKYEIKSDLEIIKNTFNKGQFGSYIKYITFPYFRNFKENSRIEFDFPLTVFVGKNGSGKSSALQALYGTPRGNNLGEYWFSTKVDPIDETNKNGTRHCYFYGYLENGITKEVLYHRAKKIGQTADYWETSRPVKKYNMVATERFRPINKSLIYMDFRSEISAFDKYFYFENPSKDLASKTKQDYLRVQSFRLKSALEDKKVFSFRGKKQNEEPIDLSKAELEAITFILGRTYIDGKIINHKFFHTWGTSVILVNKFFKYSEAFAGSGEVAVVKLVHKLISAPEKSLILLDEPEVSLHPGAQKRLLAFLLDQVKSKKHQIIVSTHSPSFVEGLPPEAIKVFNYKPDDGRFEIINKCYPSEAFWHLEESITKKAMLVFEDKLALKITEGVLSNLGEDKRSIFQLNYFPGGSSVLKQDHISVYSRDGESNRFIIFDGDQNPNVEVPNIGDMPVQDSNNLMIFKEHIERLTKHL